MISWLFAALNSIQERRLETRQSRRVPYRAEQQLERLDWPALLHDSRQALEGVGNKTVNAARCKREPPARQPRVQVDPPSKSACGYILTNRSMSGVEDVGSP